MPDVATSPITGTITIPRLRGPGTSEPRTAPMGIVATRPSNRTQVRVSQESKLRNCIPLKRNAPGIRTMATEMSDMPEVATILPTR